MGNCWKGRLFHIWKTPGTLWRSKWHWNCCKDSMFLRFLSSPLWTGSCCDTNTTLSLICWQCHLCCCTSSGVGSKASFNNGTLLKRNSLEEVASVSDSLVRAEIISDLDYQRWKRLYGWWRQVESYMIQGFKWGKALALSISLTLMWLVRCFQSHSFSVAP